MAVSQVNDTRPTTPSRAQVPLRATYTSYSIAPAMDGSQEKILIGIYLTGEVNFNLVIKIITLSNYIKKRENYNQENY